MRHALVAVAAIACGGWLTAVGAAQTRTDTVSFRDVTHISGASPQKHFEETMGSGGLLFDYDADGWVDVFLVDGGSIADPAVARQARHRLFRNRGKGSRTSVPASIS